VTVSLSSATPGLWVAGSVVELVRRSSGYDMPTLLRPGEVGAHNGASLTTPTFTQSDAASPSQFDSEGDPSGDEERRSSLYLRTVWDATSGFGAKRVVGVGDCCDLVGLGYSSRGAAALVIAFRRVGCNHSGSAGQSCQSIRGQSHPRLIEHVPLRARRGEATRVVPEESPDATGSNSSIVPVRSPTQIRRPSTLSPGRSAVDRRGGPATRPTCRRRLPAAPG